MADPTPPATFGAVRPEPPSALAAALRVAAIAPFQVLRGRRLFALLALSLGPLVVVLWLAARGRADGLGLRNFVDFAALFYFPGVFPLTLLFLGAAAIGDDIDNGTLLYLRLRPIPRASIVAGRYLAACASAWVLLSVPLALLYVVQVGWIGSGALVRHLHLLGVVLAIAALASLCYGALFLLWSLVVRAAVIVGLLIVIGWEFVLSLLPTRAAQFTVAFHNSCLLAHATDEGPELHERLALFQALDVVPAASSSVIALLAASAVFLALASSAFSRREYVEQPGAA